MRQFALALAALLTLGAPVFADHAPGQFDYYVLALSWSSGWCKTTGDARHDAQCAPGKGYTFTLHGLWPQDERDYPQDCPPTQRDPSRAQTAAMADIMASPGLAWHEWQKHGRCTGLPAQTYFETARRAYRSITIPPILARITRPLNVAPDVIEQAFLQANPGLTPAMMSVSCEHGVITEARICLTKTLTPRTCSPEVARGCPLPSADLEPVR